MLPQYKYMEIFQIFLFQILSSCNSCIYWYIDRKLARFFFCKKVVGSNFRWRHYKPRTYVYFLSLKIVCPWSIILSQQGVIFRVPTSNINALSTKNIFSGVNQNFLQRFCLFFFVRRQVKYQVKLVPNGV